MKRHGYPGAVLRLGRIVGRIGHIYPLRRRIGHIYPLEKLGAARGREGEAEDKGCGNR